MNAKEFTLMWEKSQIQATYSCSLKVQFPGKRHFAHATVMAYTSRILIANCTVRNYFSYYRPLTYYHNYFVWPVLEFISNYTYHRCIVTNT